MTDAPKPKFSALPEAKPFYASNVVVSVGTKDMKADGREAIFTMEFLDMRRRLIVSSVTVTLGLAKSLMGTLKKSIEEAEEFLKTGKKPAQAAEAPAEERSYIG